MMTFQSNSKKFEKLVVDALRRLQDIQGSTSKEISDYLSKEYDVPTNQIKKQVHLALRRGVSYGILQRNNGNTYICNKQFLDKQYRVRKTGKVIESCCRIKKKRRKKTRNKLVKRQGGHKIRGNESLLRKRKKQTKKRNKTHNRKKGKKNRINRLRRQNFNGKNDNCLELFGCALRKNITSRKRIVKNRRHPHRTQCRSKKKRGKRS